MPDDEQEARAPSRARRIALSLVVLAVALTADLWTKAWAWEVLRLRGERHVIEGFFHLDLGFNTGSAFGLLRDETWARTFFIVVTIAALLYMGRLAMTLPRRYPSVYVAIGLICAGALGNLHDRLFRTVKLLGQGERHGVVDFIVIYYWPGKRWPAFNIADAVLVAGVLLFMIYLRRTRQS